MEAIVFWSFSFIALLSAIMMVFHKNPIHSALSLIVTLFSTACLFVLLGAGFIAVMQVLVYAGAIMVLFVFVIMMLNLKREELGLRRHRIKKAIGMIICIVVGVRFASILFTQTFDKATLPQNFGSIENVGSIIFTSYVFPFELVGVLLLSAVVGAVMVAKTKV